MHAAAGGKAVALQAAKQTEVEQFYRKCGMKKPRGRGKVYHAPADPDTQQLWETERFSVAPSWQPTAPTRYGDWESVPRETQNLMVRAVARAHAALGVTEERARQSLGGRGLRYIVIDHRSDKGGRAPAQRPRGRKRPSDLGEE